MPEETRRACAEAILRAITTCATASEKTPSAAKTLQYAQAAEKLAQAYAVTTAPRY